MHSAHRHVPFCRWRSLFPCLTQVLVKERGKWREREREREVGEGGGRRRGGGEEEEENTEEEKRRKNEKKNGEKGKGCQGR